MNAEKFMQACYKKLLCDHDLLPSHISMFFALFLIRCRNKNKESFRISRKDLMLLSKINSTSTYHKCISDLVKFGYIAYAPSFNYFEGSRVQILIELYCEISLTESEI